MAFVFGKMIFLILRPSNFLLILTLLGVLNLGRRRWALYMVTVAVGGIVLCTVLPVGNWLTLPLEDRFSPPNDYPAQIDGVIVLGGGVDGDITEFRGQPSFGANMERVTAIPELARHYPNARVLFTGGLVWGASGEYTEAAVVEQFLARQGLPEGRVIFEKQARSTHDNALFSLPLAQPKLGERWLLVTSAMHMPRSMGVFSKAGWRGLQPWPVDYSTTGRFEFIAEPSMAARLAELDAAAYEWYALLYYRLLGYTSSVFPGPSNY